MGSQDAPLREGAPAMLLVGQAGENRVMRAFCYRMAGYDVEVATDLDQVEEEMAARPADIVVVSPPLGLAEVRERLCGVAPEAALFALGDPAISC